MTKIKCTVDSCHFWENNVCQAESIEVNNNQGAGSYMEAASLGRASARTSSETQCRTFRARS